MFDHQIIFHLLLMMSSPMFVSHIINWKDYQKIRMWHRKRILSNSQNSTYDVNYSAQLKPQSHTSFHWRVCHSHYFSMKGVPKSRWYFIKSNETFPSHFSIEKAQRFYKKSYDSSPSTHKLGIMIFCRICNQSSKVELYFKSRKNELEFYRRLYWRNA